MKKTFDQLRNDFPMLSCMIDDHQVIYFDNAATTYKPQQVIDAISRFYSSQYANTGRGIYPLAEQATTLFENARSAIAKFICAQHSSEIVFTSGATDSINTVIYSWALENIQAYHSIVITELEHHANLLPWQFVAQKTGAKLRYLPIDATGNLDYESLDHIIDEKTALVAFTHISNALGVPIKYMPIIQKARSVGAKVLIDASQAMIHEKIDVVSLDCDFLAFSGHKMLGPTGIGVLYIKKDLHANLVPFRRGGGMIYSAEYDTAIWAQMPQLLQAGTMPIAQAIGLHAAIEYINENLDFKDVQEHEIALNRFLIDQLQQNKQITILGPVELLKKKGHQVSFFVHGIHSHDVAAFLGQYGICVRAGNHCAQPLANKLGSISSVRVSFAFYNTKKELETFLHVFNKLFE